MGVVEGDRARKALKSDGETTSAGVWPKEPTKVKLGEVRAGHVDVVMKSAESRR